MKNKLALRAFAFILCFVTIATVFAACSDKKDNDDTDKTDGVSSYSPDWVFEPNIEAQAILPIVRADFNENTNHYDISYADCFKIMLNGKYGIINYNGELVVPAEYDSIFAIRNSDDFLAVKKGEEINEQTYIHSDTFKTQSAYKKYNTVKYEYYWNVSDSSAVFVSTENGATSKENFSPSLPETVKGVNAVTGRYIPTGKYGLYVNSRNITGMVYTNAGVFTDGLAAFESNGKWGYIDSDGRTVVPFEYDSIWGYSALGGEDTPYECSEGHITVCKNKKYGILNDDGSVLIKPMFDFATPVIKGKAFVKYEGLYGVIRVYASDDETITENFTEPSSTTTTTTTTTTTLTTEEVDTSTSATTEKSTTTTTTSQTTESTTEKVNYKIGTYTIKLSSGGSLNLRSESGIEGEIVASLSDGTVVYVDKISNGWGHTVYNGKDGWFSLKYAEMN